MKAALYARYSSDKQREASIADQFRNCKQFAEREGWTIATRYKDEAVSGSKKDRPDYQRMLADAQAKAFDMLLVDDLSRLSRDDVEMKLVIRRFKFWGIRLIGVSDGFDSDSKGHKIHAGMRGLINEIYLDDLREKTHRGLTGQALKGNNCGGRSYGYKHIPVEDPSRNDQYGRPEVTAVRREIDPEQAKWVKQIFMWFADGHSPRWIAGELNRLGAPSPRNGKWAQSAIYGHWQKGTGILNNPLYVGKYVWNRSEWVKHPDTGKRHRMERPKHDWITTDMPELRIVPQALWDRVKGRQREQYGKSGNIREALHKSVHPKYLFSGLLKCGVCGANFVMISGYQYGCASYINGGQHACGNKLRVSRRLVEERLLDGIKRELFTPEGIGLFKRETARLLAERKRASRPDTTRLKKQLATTEKEIDNIMEAIKAGILTPTTKAELEKAEAERERLQAAFEVDTRGLDKISAFLPRAVERYKAMVADLENVALRDMVRARTQIKALLGDPITLNPCKQGYLEAVLSGDYAGLLKLASGGQMLNLTGSGGRI